MIGFGNQSSIISLRYLWIFGFFLSIAISQENSRISNNSRINPRFILPESKRYHLELVLNGFHNLGIQEYRGYAKSDEEINWKLAKRTNEWDICWSWEYSTIKEIGPLTSRHRINHLPGSYVLVLKQTVYQHLVDLQKKFGFHEFNLIPQQFILPDEEEQFMKEFEITKKKLIFDQRVAKDQLYNRRWLIKSQSHRGVRFFSGLHQLQSLRSTNDMVAKCIEPLLIGGHKFDIGFYVAVTSLDPLRIYIYYNALLRFCKLPYPKNLNDAAELESYVVVKYIPPWDMPALRSYYSEMPSKYREGTNHWEILKRHLTIEKGINGEELEQSVHDSIRKMIIGNRHIFIKSFNEMRKQRKTYVNEELEAKNFFEMWRFDFIIDDNGKPWIMEVNQSPNLKQAEFTSGTDEAMKQGVVQDLINMVQVASPDHSKYKDEERQNKQEKGNSKISKTYCDKFCQDTTRDLWNRWCWYCPGWFPNIQGNQSPPSEDRNTLEDFIGEYTKRGRYRMLFPTFNPAQNQKYSQYFERGPTYDDLLIQKYMESSYRASTQYVREKHPKENPKSLKDETIAYCLTRKHCSFHGDCVNGKCICDKGYEGLTCYIPQGNSDHILPHEGQRPHSNKINTNARIQKRLLDSQHRAPPVPIANDSEFNWQWSIMLIIFLIVILGFLKVFMPVLYDTKHHHH